MGDFSYDTGYGDADPMQALANGTYTPVLTDVSNGSPDEQPSTPTGNGTGVFVSGQAEAGMWNTLTTALNYAIVRDQQKMTAVYPVMTVPQAQAGVSVQAQANSRMMTLLLIGAAVYFLVKS